MPRYVIKTKEGTEFEKSPAQRMIDKQRYAALMSDKEIQDSWDRYQKVAGKERWTLEGWLDLNYPQQNVRRKGYYQ